MQLIDSIISQKLLDLDVNIGKLLLKQYDTSFTLLNYDLVSVSLNEYEKSIFFVIYDLYPKL